MNTLEYDARIFTHEDAISLMEYYSVRFRMFKETYNVDKMVENWVPGQPIIVEQLDLKTGL